MRVERVDERGAAVDEPHARMRPAVDSALVALGTTEESLELEVVARERRVVAADEQPLLKREHHLRHVDADRVAVLSEPRGERGEIFFTFVRRAVRGVERGVDFAEGFHMTCDFVERIADEGDAAVYATREGAERLFARAPFFPPAAAVALSMESRTSPSPLAMRTPGGESGPP